MRSHRTCWLAFETERWQLVRARLVSEYQDMVSLAQSSCGQCDAAHCMTQDMSACNITIASLHGHVEVPAPVLTCVSCNRQITLHPLRLGFFPATPSRAEVWYDHELLEATSALQHAGPTALQAHGAALQ